jgi:cobalt-zinc-cadmium efflux system protein
MAEPYQGADSRAHDTSGLRLLVTLLLNLVITAVELVGGIASGSLSLVSDAFHNLGDSASVVISYGAIRLRRRPNSARHTFGLKRAEIMAAFVNSAALIAITLFLFYQAARRLAHPEAVHGELMTLVAVVGIAANLAGTLILKRGARDSLNIKATYLHMLSDVVSSVGVVIGGIAIMLWKLYWIDPIITIAIGLYIGKESIETLLAAVHVLMEGAPSGVSLTSIRDAIGEVSGVKNVHHLHIWSVGEHDVHAEAHVEVEDMLISRSGEVRGRIEHLLSDRFDIGHVTLQIECGGCDDKELVKQRATQ